MAWAARLLTKTILILVVAVLFPLGSSEGAFDGPFTGKVLDTETGRPIAGASVLASWERFYRDPIVFHGSGEHWEITHIILITTNARGDYQIPRVNIPTGLATQLGSVSLVIYEPGYEVYSARRDYVDRYGKRETFPAKDHLTRLKRISRDFDHAAHVERIEKLVPHLYLQRNRVTRQWEPVSERDGGGYPAPEREEFLRRTAWEKVMIDPTRQKR